LDITVNLEQAETRKRCLEKEIAPQTKKKKEKL
jgi:hypothetical protein